MCDVCVCVCVLCVCILHVCSVFCVLALFVWFRYKGKPVAIKKLKVWLLGEETLVEFQKEAEVRRVPSSNTDTQTHFTPHPARILSSLGFEFQKEAEVRRVPSSNTDTQTHFTPHPARILSSLGCCLHLPIQ